MAYVFITEKELRDLSRELAEKTLSLHRKGYLIDDCEDHNRLIVRGLSQHFEIVIDSHRPPHVQNACKK